MNKIINLVVVIASFISCTNETKLPDEYIRSMKVEPLGVNSPDHTVKEISEGLYKVNVKVKIDEAISQKGWAVNIFPAFEGTFHWTPHLTPTDEHIIS
ncbi:MAG: hypothetical protein JEZ14_13910, partial [Marinilabiliaceae bacterium]|nr:hypothetical protein [Marinilabiliaceae bacterium]